MRLPALLQSVSQTIYELILNQSFAVYASPRICDVYKVHSITVCCMPVCLYSTSTKRRGEEMWILKKWAISRDGIY